MGRYKRVTSHDVAREAGVSITTVSFVLNNVESGKISEDTKRRVLDAVRKLNYVPDFFAKGLKTGRSNTLGIIVPSITNPFFASIVQGAGDSARQEGYNLIVTSTYRERLTEAACVDFLLERQVDAILVPATMDPSLIEKLKKVETGIVVYNGELDQLDVSCVTTDNFRGGWLVSKHLIELGHHQIAFLSPPLSNPVRESRFAGFQRGLLDGGFRLSPDYVMISDFEGELPDVNYDYSTGYNLASDLFKRTSGKYPIAIFAFNDMLALGVIRAAADAGLRIPEDISLVGYDDIFVAALVHPGLTTIHQPKYHLGASAARLAIEHLDEEHRDRSGQRVVFQPQLRVRNSTARVDCG